jgi:hypothetical protein
VRETVVIASGAMLVPDGPGLGVDIDEKACAAHPPGTYGLRHYGGALTDIRQWRRGRSTQCAGLPQSPAHERSSNLETSS